METLEKPLSKFKQRVQEGKCGRCGEWSYPYSLCHKHRIASNIIRVLGTFEKKGWCDVSRAAKDNKKCYKWNNTAPPQARKYSPESIAKMSLPRLNGKPMTEKVIGDAILEILKLTQVPLTLREIDKNVKALKTNTKILPNPEDLLSEYKLIQNKASNLSKSQRDSVNVRINFLLKRGVINQQQLTN